VNTDDIGMCVKNAVEHPFVNMDDIGILAENAMDPGSASTINEKSAVVNVEEHPYANMVANAPNANPVADPRIANMTSFGAPVSSAHQR
jgi:hypothetical protein